MADKLSSDDSTKVFPDDVASSSVMVDTSNVVAAMEKRKKKKKKKKNSEYVSKRDNQMEMPTTVKESCNVLANFHNATPEALSEAFELIAVKIRSRTNHKKVRAFISNFVTLRAGIPCTVEAMKKFENMEDLLGKGAHFLSNLLHNLFYLDDPMWTVVGCAVLNSNVFSILANAMERFPDNGHLHFCAFFLLQAVWHAVALDTSSKSKLASILKTYLPIFENTLINHFDRGLDKDMAVEGCASVLVEASESSENRKMILDAGLDLQVLKLSKGAIEERVKNYYWLLFRRLNQDQDYGDPLDIPPLT